jgi:hypothetical protein
MALATTLACAGLLLGDLGLRLRAPRPAALALVAVVAVPSLIELAGTASTPRCTGHRTRSRITTSTGGC